MKKASRKLLKKCSLLLLALFAYLFGGAFLFPLLENDHHLAAQENLFEALVDFVTNHSCLSDESLENFFANLSQAIDMGVISSTRSSSVRDTESLWDIPTSFFFATTIVTTIGYGNFAPKTHGGHIFCAFYAIVGIPFTGFVLAAVGDALHTFWQKMRKSLHSKTTKIKSVRLRHFIHFTVYGSILYILIILLPAVVFWYTENWTLSDSQYYCFISLSTIGFGDMVAADRHMDHFTLWGYQIALVIYLLVGLSIMSTALKGLADSQKKNIVRARSVMQRLVKSGQESVGSSIKSRSLRFSSTSSSTKSTKSESSHNSSPKDKT